MTTSSHNRQVVFMEGRWSLLKNRHSTSSHIQLPSRFSLPDDHEGDALRMNWNTLLIADVCHVSIKLSWDGFSTLEGSSAFAESVYFKTLPICSARSFRSLHLQILLFYDFLYAYSLTRSPRFAAISI
jgi:hypothetical protein